MKFLLLILLLSVTSIYASEDENILKGVMLERISQFITYDQEDDFLICTYKSQALYKSFSKLFEHRSYQGKPMRVQNLQKLFNAKSCDILYIEQPNKKVIKKAIENHFDFTLLVTDNEKLLDEGFMLALYLENKKIKFSINQKALLDARLKVNYRLLRVASKVVNPLRR